MSRFGPVFWGAIAACGAGALVAGMIGSARVSSRAASRTRTVAVATPRPPTPKPHLPAEALGNDWDVVVDRASSPNPDGSARLAVVVGPCGTDAAIDAAFARVDLPIGIVIDPARGDAVATAALARSSGKPFYLQVARVPSPAAIGRLLQRFDGAAGFASPNRRGMATALAGTGLTYLDERGDADPKPFAKAGTGLIRRDLTVDDRDATGFVSFMLQRAIVLGAARGRAVVWMRPRASSLLALRGFAKRHAPEVVAFGP